MFSLTQIVNYEHSMFLAFRIHSWVIQVFYTKTNLKHSSSDEICWVFLGFLDFFLYLHWVSGIMDVYSLAMFSAKNMRV